MLCDITMSGLEVTRGLARPAIPCTQALEQVGVVVTRDQWLGYAEHAERTKLPATCR